MAKKKKQVRYKAYHELLAKGCVFVDDGVVKYSSIYNYILQLDQKELDEELDKRIEKYGYFPPIQKVLKPFILKKFFPQFIGPLSTEYAGQQISDMENITIPNIWGCLTKEARLGSKEAGKVTAWYLSSIFTQIAQYKVTCKDGEIYHVADYRINPDKYTRELLENVTRDEESLLANTILVARGFLQLLLARKELSREELSRLAGWYLEDLCLDKSREGSKCILKALNEILGLKDKITSDFILGLYEDHSASFDKMIKMHPDLDFVRRGTCKRYESFDAFVKEHGETEDFFTEEANLGEKTGGSAPSKRQINKAKREEYKEKVLKDMRTIFMEVQEFGTEFHVLNFTQNELKIRTPSSNYVAVAFKKDDEWYILVDSLRLGEGAIFLWKGEYAKGLEVLKQARSFARETPGITHKNHYYSVDNIVKYRAIIKEAL
ncbi:hypothetical protein IK110_01145 [Candidatus Saccharibacteria bacterium]|nr:hypothetical protein [Candidatus Saccharibacteria bacterium]